ncbi:MAG TPA: hypothetical protein VF703_00940 [Pyrinomonadaceae bacterium]|jgi:hypothetical protein
MNRLTPLKAIKLIAVAMFLILSASINSVTAQTPAPTATPESEEIKKLRDDKTRAELERDIAVAEKARNDATSPKPSSAPLAGETKINDGAVIENEMISYLSMAYAANRIVERLRETDNLAIKNLAIYNKADIDLLLNYKATRAQLAILKKEFCKHAPEATECGGGDKGFSRSPTAALGMVGSFLGAFIDATALLRTNVTVQGHTFDISEAALVSEVFRAVRADDGLDNNPALYYPAAFPPVDPKLDTSQLLNTLEELNDLKAKVLVALAEQEETLKEITKAKADIAKLKGFDKDAPQQILDAEANLKLLEELKQEEERAGRALPFEALERLKRLRESIKQMKADHEAVPAKLKAAEALLKQLETGQDGKPQNEDQRKEVVAKMKLVNERFDQLIATLIKTDAATGINSLTAYIRAENMKQVMGDEKGSYWLQLAVVKAGGNNRIKTNLLVDLFTGGSRLSHSGGVIVQYSLYDLNGRSIVSDTLTEYTGYTKAGRIKRLINPINVIDTPKRTPAHP